MKPKLLLLIIVCLALFLRIYRLNGYPPSFWQDITANAYDAYSILLTGKDQWGTSFPFPLIKSLGDYKTALPVYFLIPGIKIFGLNEFGVRINMAIIGVLTVIIAYFVGKRIGKSEIFGLILAFFLAVSPWHIGLVRHSWEVVLGIFFFLIGLCFLLDFDRKGWNFAVASVFLGISSYTYHPYRVFAPLFFVLVLFYLLKERKIVFKWFLLSQIIFLLIFLPNFLSLINPTGRVRIEVNRFDRASEFIQQTEGKNTIEKNITRLSFISKNYFRLFSTDFLFVWGSTDPVFETKDRGVSYFLLVPFFLYGLYFLVKRRNIIDNILLLWLLLWPIPTVIVSNPYNLVKTAHLIPLLEIISTIGTIELMRHNFFKKYKIFCIFCSLIIIAGSLLKYFVDYYATYPLYSSTWYQGVEKNTFAAIDEKKDKYENIILSQKLEPYIYLLFYEKIDPQYYQTTKDKNIEIAGKFGEAHLKNLGKFVYSTGIENNISDKNLYAFPPEEIPQSKVYQPIIFNRIKDYLGNDRLVIFSWQRIRI